MKITLTLILLLLTNVAIGQNIDSCLSSTKRVKLSTQSSPLRGYLVIKPDTPDVSMKVRTVTTVQTGQTYVGVEANKETAIIYYRGVVDSVKLNGKTYIINR